MIKNLPFKIRLVAPSSSANAIDKSAFDRAVSYLRSKSFVVTYSEVIFEEENGIPLRVEDLHHAFQSDADVIMTVRGGFESNELLEYIDNDLVAKAEKKFFGFSDTTVLLNALYTGGNSTFVHGPNLMTFAQYGEREKTFQNFENALNGTYDISSFDIYGNYTSDGENILCSNLCQPFLQEGMAEGVICGGNLSSLQLLFGTQYMFSKDEDIILFIEEDDLCGTQSPQMFKRAFHHLSQQEISQNIKGIIFGRFENGSNINSDFLKLCLKDTGIFDGIPAAMNFSFGHTIPTGCFPIGGYCEINITKEVQDIKIRDSR